MKTVVCKDALNWMALCACVLSALSIAQSAEPTKITVTADNWQTKENADFLRLNRRVVGPPPAGAQRRPAEDFSSQASSYSSGRSERP